MPTCPFGELIYQAVNRLNVGYEEAIRLINAAGAADGESHATYNRTALTRWLTGTIPPARTQRWIGSALNIPPAKLAEAADAQRAQRQAATDFTLPAYQPLLRDVAFSNAALDGPADHAFIELAHQSIRQLVLLDNHFGGDEIAGIAVRLFRTVTNRLSAGLYEPAIERDLMATAGELGELAGWLLFDADRQEASRQVNSDALYWATIAGDEGMVNFILSNVALQAIHTRRPLEALHVAQRIREQEGRLSPRVRALYHVREGRALALARREHDAQRDFERAWAFFGDGVRGSDPQWTWWIDDFELTGHEGLCHLETGDTKGAVKRFRRAIETCPSGRARDRFMYHAHLLRTTVELKDWPTAASVLDRIVPSVDEMASGRIASFLRDSTARVKRDTSAPASVRDGAAQLDELLTAARHSAWR